MMVRLVDEVSQIGCDDAGLQTGSVRFDAGAIGRLERTPTGGVRAPARVTRTGVLVYLRADGTESREWRPPEEVFHADSLRSLADAAVTIGHPTTGRVTPETFKRDAVGHVREDGRQDGRFVATTLTIQEAGAIARIDTRELGELSCGYSCDIERRSGTTPEGERYDAIQRRIRYNHVALLPQGGGRAGRDVALRVDGAAAEITESAMPTPIVNAPQRVERRDHMKTERIDGIEYEIGTTAHSQARERHDARVKAELEAAQKAVKDAETKATSEAARADAAEKRIKELEAELAPAKLDARVSDRASLLERVRPVLGADVKLDGKSEAEIMVLAVTKLDAGFKLDSIPEPQRETYVRARFEAEMRHAKSSAAPSPVAQARADAFASITPSNQQPAIDLSAYRVRPGDRI